MITRTTNLLSHGRWWMFLALIVCLMPARVAVAQDGGHRLTEREFSQLGEVLEMLQHGIGALNELDRRYMAEVLGVVAHEVRGQLERASADRGERRHRDKERTERQIVEERLEVLRAAFKVVREAEHRDAAEQLEHAIHAHELMLEVRRGAEARTAIRTAPKHGQMMELLGHAAHLYHELGMPDRAEKILHMREELWPTRERPRDLSQHDFEAAVNRIEVMRMALRAILEAGREDTAELLQRAIRFYEETLEGRRDREARHIREQAPSLGQQIEILVYAAELWKDFGHVDKAEVLAETAEHLRRHLEGRAHLADEEGRDRVRERAQWLRDQDRETLIDHIEELHQRAAELERIIERLRDER